MTNVILSEAKDLLRGTAAHSASKRARKMSTGHFSILSEAKDLIGEAKDLSTTVITVLTGGLRYVRKSSIQAQRKGGCQ